MANRELEFARSFAEYVGYQDGQFTCKTIGCGCCSDMIYDLNQSDALEICDSMIKKWQETREKIQNITMEQIKKDILENANL